MSNLPTHLGPQQQTPQLVNGFVEAAPLRDFVQAGELSIQRNLGLKLTVLPDYSAFPWLTNPMRRWWRLPEVH